MGTAMEKLRLIEEDEKHEDQKEEDEEEFKAESVALK